MNKITIAIDGYSSCGKSTTAKALARKLGYSYIDTGAMYRAVTFYFLKNNIDVDNITAVRNALEKIEITFRVNESINSENISDVYLNGRNVEQEIRQMDVSNNVSKISAIKEVRVKMVKLQQEMGKHKGVVLDGRDIGTVVFPNAELKIFMTANPFVRAKRRFDELKAKSTEVSMAEVQANIEKRDYIDTHREESPLTQAKDAIVLDNTHLSREEQLEFVMKLIPESYSKNEINP